MTLDQFNKLKQHEIKWILLRDGGESSFLPQDLESIKLIHLELFGWVNGNISCSTCVNELLKRVFTEYDKSNA
jgi:hypothetical protein